MRRFKVATAAQAIFDSDDDGRSLENAKRPIEIACR